MKSGPARSPRLGYRVLSLALRRGEHDVLLGDIEECFSGLAKEKGEAAARLWYWGQVMRFLPAYILFSISWSVDMFKNYLVTSLRNIKKHKGYSFLNVLGLAIGMAACLLVLLYTRDELSWDRYNKNADRICRVVVDLARQGTEMTVAGAGAPVAAAMIKGFPEVEDAVRFNEAESMLQVRYGDKQFRENRAVHTDPSFFNIFSVPLLTGDPGTALTSPKTLVLSRSTARKYFGREDPIGKTLQLSAESPEDYRVTGVFEDIPRASHFHFDILISLSTLEAAGDPMMTSWMSFNFPTYFLLREGASVRDLERKLPSLISAHSETEIRQLTGGSLADFLSKTGMKLDYHLQPLTRIHLYSASGLNDFEPAGDIRSVLLFATVALFILILAAVNFVNLSTARSAGRAKEVGLRKVLGSFRGALVRQFLVESIVLSLMALAIAVLIVRLALPIFSQLSGKELRMAALGQPVTAAIVMALTLAIGLLAGAYPAFFISAFRPSPILRGQPAGGVKGGRFRRALVVFQFAVSAIMIVGTIVVSNQLRFIQNKKLGFNKSQVLILRHADLLGNRAESLKEEMLRFPQVLRASLSSYLPVPSARAAMPVARQGDPDPRQALPISIWTVDHEYIDTLEIKIAAGRNFSRQFPSDSQAVLLNEAAVRHFGFDSPLGQPLAKVEVGPGGPSDMRTVPYTVVGVMEDFHYESLRDLIGPLMVRLGPSRGNLILRIKSDDITGTIGNLRRKWEALLPGEPFDYAFLDESFDRMYRAELRLGRTFGVFAGLALFIGGLGLFGLASFAAVKRMREIGVHKVFGATALDIVRLLVREYVLLVAVANLAAWPVSFWLMSRWLNGFAYRTGVGWEAFAATGALTLVIALLTVGYQSFKAASADPAVVLKYE